MTQAIGFVGTGLMGSPMALGLLGAGFSVQVYNRTPEKLAPLIAAGGTAAGSVAALVRSVDRLVLMLTDGTAIRELLLTPAVDFQGKTVVQMGTIAPQESRDLAVAIGDRGGMYLEAPVLGSIPEATAGKLLVMVGGDPAVMAANLDILRVFGPEPQHIGPVGTAAALKLALNQLITSLTSAFSLSHGFCQREGVPMEALMGILRSSALYAPTFDKKLDRMNRRQFDHPNFPTKHLLKDTRLFLEAAQPHPLDTRFLAILAQLLEKAIAQGYGDSDYAALYQAIHGET